MSEVLLDTIQARAKYARQCRGLSQEQLARVMKSNQKSISNLEAGKDFTTAMITKLATALEVEIHWLLTGKGKLPLLKPRLTKPLSTISQLNLDMEVLRKTVATLTQELDDMKVQMAQLTAKE